MKIQTHNLKVLFYFANRYENEKYPTVLIYGHGDVVQGEVKKIGKWVSILETN